MAVIGFGYLLQMHYLGLVYCRSVDSAWMKHQISVIQLEPQCSALIKPFTDEQVFYDKFLCDKFYLPSVRVYAQHFLYDKFLCDKFFLPVCTSQQFYFDKFSLLTVQTDKFFTLPIFSMTSALVEKLAC